MLPEAQTLFPYKMRPIQERMVSLIDDAIGRKGHIVMEAGTGSGKTVSSLAPALAHAYKGSRRVLFLTRTNSQQRQVVEEFRRIRARSARGPAKTPPPPSDIVDQILRELNGGKAVEPASGSQDVHVQGTDLWEGGSERGLCCAIQGRGNMCPLAAEDPEFLTGTPEELSRMCGERKRNTLTRMSGRPIQGKECRFYASYLLDEGAEARSWAREVSPTAEEMAQRCLSIGICPYETTKRMVSDSVLVTAPYIFFLSPFIRRRLLEWMGCGTEDLIVIVDEAHNVAQFARELCSLSLSLTTLRLAAAEAETYGDKRVGKQFKVSLLIDALSGALQTLAEEFLIDEDGTVPPSALMDTLMVQLRTGSSQLERAFSEILQYGVSIQDTKRAQGRLPRSYLHRTAQFFLAWSELDFSVYSPLIVKGQRPGELFLEAFAMDPSHVTGELSKAHSSIHLSGTLSPLEEYRDTLGLPADTELVKLPPPFPPENRVLTYTPDLCTSYEMLRKDPEMKDRYRKRLLGMLERCVGINTAVFFPSFDLMEGVLGAQELEDGSLIIDDLPPDRELFLERRGSSQPDVMDLVDGFRSSSGGVLCSVMGGRLSEGMDYPGRSLELVLIVGIPYPKPNARQRSLSSFYDIRFGKGWEYTVHAPAARKMLQAVGRMIRSEDDRGFSVVMDRRAVHFRDELGEVSVLDEDLNIPVRFFRGKD